MTLNPSRRGRLRRALAVSSTGLVVAALAAPGAASAQSDAMIPPVSDITPPNSTLSYDIPAWSAFPLTDVTISATDPNVGGPPPSGVDCISYKVMLGNVEASTHDTCGGESVTLTLGDGEHLVYWAVDLAGNKEAEHTSGTLQIDSTAPTVSLSPAVAAPWYKTEPEVTITGSDAQSGVAGGVLNYRLNSGDRGTQRVVLNKTISVAGGQATVTVPDGATLTAMQLDAVDNFSSTATFGPVHIDADAPITTASAIPSSGSAPVPVTLTATDAKSGVASTQFQVVGIDGKLIGSPATYNAASLPVLTSGQALRFWSTDVAGNVEAAQTTAPANGAAVVPAATIPNADLKLLTNGKRVLFLGTKIPVKLTCGAGACRVKTAVAFVAQGKTIVALSPRLTSLAAGATETEKFPTTRKQRKAIRRMMGASGTGGEIRLTTVLVDAAGVETGTPVLTRRGLRKTSAA